MNWSTTNESRKISKCFNTRQKALLVWNQGQVLFPSTVRDVYNANSLAGNSTIRRNYSMLIIYWTQNLNIARIWELHKHTVPLAAAKRQCNTPSASFAPRLLESHKGMEMCTTKYAGCVPILGTSWSYFVNYGPNKQVEDKDRAAHIQLSHVCVILNILNKIMLGSCMAKLPSSYCNWWRKHKLHSYVILIIF